jgi:anti-sigma regulatory factor (Ser/Thr protein kinase)
MDDPEGSPVQTLSLTAPAVPESLRLVQASLADFRALVTGEAAVQIDPAVWNAFETGLTEIATNIIRHAYVDNPPGNFTLSLRALPHQLEALLTDQGQTFREPPPRGDIESFLDDLPEGGFGLMMARALLDALEYERVDDENRWHLTKPM